MAIECSLIYNWMCFFLFAKFMTWLAVTVRCIFLFFLRIFLMHGPNNLLLASSHRSLHLRLQNMHHTLNQIQRFETEEKKYIYAHNKWKENQWSICNLYYFISMCVFIWVGFPFRCSNKWPCFVWMNCSAAGRGDRFLFYFSRSPCARMCALPFLVFFIQRQFAKHDGHKSRIIISQCLEISQKQKKNTKWNNKWRCKQPFILEMATQFQCFVLTNICDSMQFPSEQKYAHYNFDNSRFRFINCSIPKHRNCAKKKKQ